jgi:hypothetical protein
MNLSRREKWIASMTAAVILLWAADGWIFTPLYRAYTNDAGKLRKASADLLATESLLRQAPAMEASWREARDAGIAEPAPKAVSSMLEHLQGFAQQANLRIDMRPNVRPATEDFQLLQCRISATGRLGQITTFCYLIEVSPAPLRIEKMRLSSQDPTRDDLRLQMDISCKLYRPEDRGAYYPLADGRQMP